MNSLARIPTPPASHVAPSKGVAKSLAMAESALIPALIIPWADDLYRAISTASTPLESVALRYRSPERLAEQVSDLRKAIATGPDKDTLDAFALPIVEAKATPPDRAQTIALVAMMLDSYPSGRPANLSAYADSLVHDLIDLKFSPAVVAMACRSIRPTSKFLPSGAEMVEAAEKAKSELTCAIRHANQTALSMDKARSILIEAEAAMSNSAPAAEVAA